MAIGRASCRLDWLSASTRTMPMLCVLLVLAAGCSNGVTLVVDVRTDLRPDFEFGSVELLVTRADGSLARRAIVPALRHDDFLGGQRVAELVDLASGSYALDTRLLDGAGTPVLSRRTSIEMRDDLAVIVVITRDCRGLTCPASGAPLLTECLGGRCVSPACAAGDSTMCPPPLCATSADCTSATACAPSACTLGLCLARPDDALCPTGDWCDPTHGCTAIALLDAGTTDAGTRDASSGTDAGCRPGGACNTGNDCEDGMLQCVGGSRTCVAVGPTAAGTVCRASAGPCDRVESCDGSSPVCPPDGFYGSGRGCRAAGGPCNPGESCDGSGPDCPPDDVAPDGTSCGASWSQNGCGPIDMDTCQGGTCTHDANFTGGQPSCGAVGVFCGLTPQCCGSGGMFCVSPGAIYNTNDCSQCCAAGNCCMDGNPAGPCI